MWISPLLPGKPSKRSATPIPEFGFDYQGCAVLSAIEEQSPVIAMGVKNAFDDPMKKGAGDRG
jgi:S-adenosylmethionine synthetase